MKVYVQSIPRTEAERSRWSEEKERCPKCDEFFGTRKLIRVDENSNLSADGIVRHKNCPKK